MKTSTKTAIAQLLASAGAVLAAFATEMSSEAPASPEAASQPEAPKRGRTKAAAAAAATPAEPQETTETAEEPAAATPTNGAKPKTYEDMRALIQGPVKAGQGEEVKKEIAKFSPTGLKDMDPKHYAEFEKNIIALSY